MWSVDTKGMKCLSCGVPSSSGRPQPRTVCHPAIFNHSSYSG